MKTFTNNISDQDLADLESQNREQRAEIKRLNESDERIHRVLDHWVSVAEKTENACSIITQENEDLKTAIADLAEKQID